MELVNPLNEAREIEGMVLKENRRKYYRVGRAGNWYGGISTADCCGCNLKCVFCWSTKPRDHFLETGRFYPPEEVAFKLIEVAIKKGYHLLRISGNEPTIGKLHLLNLLQILSRENYLFILETNGTLLDKDYVKELKIFKKLHIRVSLKGTDGEEYKKLTLSIPETFELVLSNIKNLVEENLNFNIAIMASFSPEEKLKSLKEKLKKISRKTLENLEEEYVILYPVVEESLKRAGIFPKIFCKP
ncbi:MAG: radical SAM protein [Thermoanaerobaculia bacterium]